MKRSFLFLLALLACPILHADTTEAPNQPIIFSGGVDYKNDCSHIRDDRACDSSNFVSYRYGSVERRLGSKRLIDQAISSNPITSLYRAYTSSQGVSYHAIIATTWDRVYYTTNDVTPTWALISSGNAHNQHYSFEMMNGKVLISGDRLTDPIRQFDIVSGSVAPLFQADVSTEILRIRAKYLKQSRNYLIGANIADVTLAPSTTFYSNRIAFSRLAQPSSFTATRWIEIRSPGVEEITGLFELNGRVEITFPSSIYELSFTALDLTASGGDEVLTPIAVGFGLIAPRCATSDGAYLYGLSMAGIFKWDGGRITRQTAQESKSIISNAIEPIINKIIRAKTYTNAILKYYQKRNWLLFAYEDPDRLPHGSNNSAMVYDLVIGEWYPLANWNIDGIATFDGNGDSGDLLLGDSSDGIAYYGDRFGSANDVRRQMVIDTMDSSNTATGPWLRGVPDFTTTHVIEGTGSLKLSNTASVKISSTARIGVINLRNWQDGTLVSLSDKIQFKVFVSSFVENISTITLDLEIEDQPGADFDLNFTSIAISSAVLTGGTSGWTTIEVPLSSFTILDSWISLASEQFPTADSLTFYGIRFGLFSIGQAEVYIDDVRLIGGTGRPLNCSRLSKQFNLGSDADKTFREMLLDAEVPSGSSLSIDVFKDFGRIANTISIPALFNNELYVAGYGGRENLTRLNSINFSYLASTQFASPSVAAFRSIVADKDYLYCNDRYNHRLVKIAKNNLGVFVSSMGSIGSGPQNFNNAFQHAIDDKYIYVADMGNHRIKVHQKSDLSFVFAFGQLSKAATGFHLPTGVTVDEKFLYVGDDGNRKIKKLNKSTGAFITQTDLNVNTFGNTTLANDEEFLYDAYNTLTSTSMDNVDVILEKRRKSDLTLVNKVLVRPQNSLVLISSYIVMGDIAIQNDYIYLSFTDDENGNGSYYIQKRQKSDFSIITEYKSTNSQYGLAADGMAYLPRRQLFQKDLQLDDTIYIQYRFYESALDNPIRLLSYSYGVIAKPFTER